VKIAYPALFEPQPEGGYTVTFPDLPEAISEGDSLEEARFNGAECLSLVLDVRIGQGEAIPLPAGREGMEWIEPAAATQAALLVHLTREAEQKSLTDLARALGTSWPAVRRLEDPRHPPTIKQLERAAAALGKRLVLSFEG
jgi:antitoxin HicB